MFHVKEYVRPQSLQEAYELNQKRSSVLVAGMMWLKMGNSYKVTAVDLSGLGLDGIEEDEQGFRIGCMCSLRQLELHPGLNACFDGVFKECTRHIVGTQFRNGATVGGSIFGRYGFSDILTCMMMLDAYVELYKGGIVPLDTFAQMKYDRDILVRVIIKKDGRRAAYVTQRNSKTDFPVIACGAAKRDQQYFIAVGARPEKARLVVMDRGNENPAAVAKAAAEQYTYHSNMRAGGEYRRYLAEVYLRRLIEQLEKEEA